ncbi:MAG: hypothetical protein A2504_07570 [Bdellovibrionales bacterium RIFOXYD12_FULL_39_22]|nr:MAG: hypothetical protein A2385_13840 [Bdellovibrionales bacterium RIFOXYB1_FULL_39_21]OFZ48959.1 MAG: hypothetical protein A2404_09605 [Bdellovibrionales bacterium RIFOXYC1_FULL_39_130]OFZ72936.1 MAG: hypothetical protein A2451_02005 [Bdellovibrionales bacterium RIFOXYC2_FULL_39_8]OFZ76946.1 MAG: hypothetical protein A2560_16605 [Bdellovibrionales bacterium RIFOXYD1_FULL_39_84]OFZ96017.1 MAG: hypothetical protein A2504_07570 [Bdellovibrionales bacterium RIFOXYD12_FULL_39_22]
MKLLNSVVSVSVSVILTLGVAPVLASDIQYIAFSTEKVLDLKTTGGDVVTIDEIKDGFSQVAGTKIVGSKLLMKKSAPVVNMKLFNGAIVDFKAAYSGQSVMGGDMGGGGKGGAKL